MCVCVSMCVLKQSLHAASCYTVPCQLSLPLAQHSTAQQQLTCGRAGPSTSRSPSSAGWPAVPGPVGAPARDGPCGGWGRQQPAVSSVSPKQGCGRHVLFGSLETAVSSVSLKQGCQPDFRERQSCNWRWSQLYFCRDGETNKQPHLMQPARRGMCASTRAVYWMSMSDSATMMLLRTTGKGDLPSSCARHSTQHSTTCRRQTHSCCRLLDPASHD